MTSLSSSSHSSKKRRCKDDREFEAYVEGVKETNNTNCWTGKFLRHIDERSADLVNKRKRRRPDTSSSSSLSSSANVTISKDQFDDDSKWIQLNAIEELQSRTGCSQERAKNWVHSKGGASRSTIGKWMMNTVRPESAGVVATVGGIGEAPGTTLPLKRKTDGRTANSAFASAVLAQLWDAAAEYVASSPAESTREILKNLHDAMNNYKFIQSAAARVQIEDSRFKNDEKVKSLKFSTKWTFDLLERWKYGKSGLTRELKSATKVKYVRSGIVGFSDSLHSNSATTTTNSNSSSLIHNSSSSECRPFAILVQNALKPLLFSAATAESHLPDPVSLPTSTSTSISTTPAVVTEVAAAPTSVTVRIVPSSAYTASTHVSYLNKFCSPEAVTRRKVLLMESMTAREAVILTTCVQLDKKLLAQLLQSVEVEVEEHEQGEDQGQVGQVGQEKVVLVPAEKDAHIDDLTGRAKAKAMAARGSNTRMSTGESSITTCGGCANSNSGGDKNRRNTDLYTGTELVQSAVI